MSMMHAAYGPEQTYGYGGRKHLALRDLQSIGPGLVQPFGPDIRLWLIRVKRGQRESRL